EPALKRLTFCLLGTATPADLIQDTRTTPFNIGKRIELRDFTNEEAAPLAAGLISRQDAKTQRQESTKDTKGHEEKQTDYPQITQIDTDFNAEEESAGLAVVSEGYVAAGPPAKDITPSFHHSITPPPSRSDEGKRLLERVLYWTGGHPYL